MDNLAEWSNAPSIGVYPIQIPKVEMIITVEKSYVPNRVKDPSQEKITF